MGRKNVFYLCMVGYRTNLVRLDPVHGSNLGRRASYELPRTQIIFENRSRKSLKQLSTLGNPTLKFLHTMYEQRIAE